MGTQVVDSNQLWYSLDSGKTWRAGPSVLPFAEWPYNTGDIEGFAEAIYVQTLGDGLFRSTDRGQTWKNVGGPSNGLDTRFCVPPSCDGGTVIAFDTNGGVWLTTDGGDGALQGPERAALSYSSLPPIAACNTGETIVQFTNDACPNGFTLTGAKIEGDTVHFALDSVPPLPLSFGGDATESFYVRFSPKKTAGNFASKLHITGTINEADTSLPFDTLVDINASALPEPIALTSSADSINFDTVNTCVGKSDSVIEMFVNNGCGIDTIQSITQIPFGFVGSEDSLPIILQPGDSLQLFYQFIPPDSGTFSGTVKLHVTSMGLTEDPVISLTGHAVQGRGVLDVHSTSLLAGSFSFCSGDTVLTDTLRNTGCDTLVISNMQLAGDSAFSLLSVPDSLLLPGASKIVGINFAPRVKGAQNAVLTFHERNIVNDPGRDTTVTITGFGLGGTTALAVNTAPRDFGALFACQEKDTTIWLRNPGCDALTLDSGVFSNGNYASDATYPLIIPAGDSVPVRISLISGVSANQGSENGSVTFYTNANTGPGTETVPLQATIIPPAQLQLSLSSAQSGHDGNVVTFYVILTGDSGAAAKYLSRVSFDLTHNDNLLTFLSANGLGVTGQGAGTAPLHFTASALGTSDTLGTLTFRTYLTDSSETPLTLSNVSFSNTLGLQPDCIASVYDSGSGFTYLYNCGDHELQKFLQTGRVALSIESIVPNPATNTVMVRISRSMAGTVCELYDALGREVISQSLSGNAVALDVAALPSGIYSLRISNGPFDDSRSVVIRH